MRWANAGAQAPGRLVLLPGLRGGLAALLRRGTDVPVVRGSLPGGERDAKDVLQILRPAVAVAGGYACRPRHGTLPGHGRERQPRLEAAEALAEERARHIEDLRKLLTGPESRPARRRWWRW